MIKSFFSDPSFFVALAFICLPLLGWRHIKKTVQAFLQNYRTSISSQFDEANRLLAEAQELLRQTLVKHQDHESQATEIVNLAHIEAKEILAESHQLCAQIKKAKEYHLQQHSLSLIREWKKETFSEILKAFEAQVTQALEPLEEKSSFDFFTSHIKHALHIPPTKRRSSQAGPSISSIS